MVDTKERPRTDDGIVVATPEDGNGRGDGYSSLPDREIESLTIAAINLESSQNLLPANLSEGLDFFLQYLENPDEFCENFAERYPTFIALVQEMTTEQIECVIQFASNFSFDLFQEDRIKDRLKISPEQVEFQQCTSLAYGLTVAKLLDESSPLHPASSSQAENMAYLKKTAGAAAQLDSHLLSGTFPYKIQILHALHQANLADPDTRAYPLWDIISLADRVVSLIEQERNVWISTTGLNDISYAGVKKNDNAPMYQLPALPSLIQELNQELSQLQKQNLFTTVAETPSPSLYKRITTLSHFFFEVLPRLTAAQLREPASFCKVFPQDGSKGAANEFDSMATLILELGPVRSTSELTPRVSFEAMLNIFTSRDQNEQNFRVTIKQLEDQHPLIFADHQSCVLFYNLMNSTMADGGNFLTKIEQLIKQTGVISLAIDMMYNSKTEQICFCFDAIPIVPPNHKLTQKLKNCQRPWQRTLSQLMDNLLKTRVLPPEELGEIRRRIKHMLELSSAVSEAQQGTFYRIDDLMRETKKKRKKASQDTDLLDPFNFSDPERIALALLQRIKKSLAAKEKPRSATKEEEQFEKLVKPKEKKQLFTFPYWSRPNWKHLANIRNWLARDEKIRQSPTVEQIITLLQKSNPKSL
ncbi:MAG: hypothetical protein PVJ09_00480 [Candidatus Woesebacteria bacterium]|jgi:hypothetical protein